MAIRAFSSFAPRSVKAAICTELGKKLSVQNWPTAQNLTDKKIRIAVSAAGVNFADILMCQGGYQVRPEVPFVPGFEAAGEVIEVGAGVVDFKPGDKVVALQTQMTGGAFAEEFVVQEKQLYRLPESVNFVDAAALPVSYGTALVALESRAAVKRGETVLITAAAGSVGLAAVELATKVFGAKVIAATGSDLKRDLCRHYGAHHTINYQKENLRNALTEITNGKGVDVVIDAVGGNLVEQCVKSMAWEGRIVILGFASGQIPSIPTNLLLLRNCSAIGLYWGAYAAQISPHHVSTFRSSIDRVIQLCALGTLKPHVIDTFNLEQINDAFRHIRERKSTGKVVLSIS